MSYKKETIESLSKIKTLEAEINDSQILIQDIKDSCPHLDHSIEITETYQYCCTPRAICPVCGKDKQDVTITLEQKIKAFSTYFGYEVAENLYTLDEINAMAEEGGYNFP